jgi:hypothetical protein
MVDVSWLRSMVPMTQPFELKNIFCLTLCYIFKSVNGDQLTSITIVSIPVCACEARIFGGGKQRTEDTVSAVQFRKKSIKTPSSSSTIDSARSDRLTRRITGVQTLLFLRQLSEDLRIPLSLLSFLDIAVLRAFTAPKFRAKRQIGQVRQLTERQQRTPEDKSEGATDVTQQSKERVGGRGFDEGLFEFREEYLQMEKNNRRQEVQMCNNGYFGVTVHNDINCGSNDIKFQ